MDDIFSGASRFRCDVFPSHKDLYARLATHGQQPKALIVSCSDSRVVPELITQSGPGELFVCRNAGAIVPPYGDGETGGVSATIEYAVSALGVRDIVVCGHSDCGAMKGLLNPDALKAMPSVAAWLGHGRAACEVVRDAYPADLSASERLTALIQENVVAQLAHLRTHPSVASALAQGRLTLHGWVFDLATGALEVLDGEDGAFRPLRDDAAPPVAQRPHARGLAWRAELQAAA